MRSEEIVRVCILFLTLFVALFVTLFVTLFLCVCVVVFVVQTIPCFPVYIFSIWLWYRWPTTMVTGGAGVAGVTDGADVSTATTDAALGVREGHATRCGRRLTRTRPPF